MNEKKSIVICENWWWKCRSSVLVHTEDIAGLRTDYTIWHKNFASYLNIFCSVLFFFGRYLYVRMRFIYKTLNNIDQKVDTVKFVQSSLYCKNEPFDIFGTNASLVLPEVIHLFFRSILVECYRTLLRSRPTVVMQINTNWLLDA